MGIIIGLVSAVSTATVNVFVKKLSEVAPEVLTILRFATSIPILAVLVIFFSEWFIPPPLYWSILIFIIVPLEAVFHYLLIKALHLSPMSIVGPIGAFTGIFLIPVGYIVLGELPTMLGLFGILLIFTGSFFLSWSLGGGFVSGMKKLFSDHGVVLALLAAFIASLLAVSIKFVFQYTPPLLSAFYMTVFVTLFFIPFTIRYSRASLVPHVKGLAGLGILSGFSTAIHFVGLSLLPAVYFISIKRLSIIFAVLFGHSFFKETNIRERLIGAVFMVVGVVLIILG